MQVLSYYWMGATLNNKTIKIITILNLVVILFTYPLYVFLSSGGYIVGAILCFILIWGLRFLISVFFLFRTNIDSDKF